jgi:uncharacterized protein YqiB (DUF1249 family)
MSNRPNRPRKRRSELLALQNECGANFVRLMRLFPHWEQWEEREFALDVGRHEQVIRLRVTERNPYTTMLEVSQREALLPWSAGINLQVRVYHDADMAEVVAWNRHRNLKPRYGYPNEFMHQPDEKAQMNAFLGEWLTQCLQYGRAAESVMLG